MTTCSTKDGGAAVSLTGAGKWYDLPARKGFWALRDISIDIGAGRITGIIGRNGAGKTTLLRIIAGVLSITEGSVNVRGRRISLFTLGNGFSDELTGRENVFINGTILGASRRELESVIGAIIDFSELGAFIDRPLGAYSQGMRLRLAFSIVANLNFDLLILDEILAVGDNLFRLKCLERLMDFKRRGASLIVTTQDLDLIERLSDSVMLLEHGRCVYAGEPSEAVSAYRKLLSKDHFYVGAGECELIETTKKWADDRGEWATRSGTKEATIDHCAIRSGMFGLASAFRPHSSLRVRIDFTAHEALKDVHFGVAIFRHDGVYCYGPNTFFDGYCFPLIGRGKGSCTLSFSRIDLAPGEYRVSAAIWDRTEGVAYDYHNGCYAFTVSGENRDNALLAIGCKVFSSGVILAHSSVAYVAQAPDSWPVHPELAPVMDMFALTGGGMAMTGDTVRLIGRCSPGWVRKGKIWVGLYREDGIYCQGVCFLPARADFEIRFPAMQLLPGQYRFSVALIDSAGSCLWCSHGAVRLRVSARLKDHGTVRLDHRWSWRLPR